MTPQLKLHGLARGSGSAGRMICLADGEPALEDSLCDCNPHYLERCEQSMCYGKFGKEGYHIGSGHVEAAIRVLVVSRCVQAGMHRRYENAVGISAIHAHYTDRTAKPPDN